MVKVKLIVDGGSMKPSPAVAQQLGPMGINLGKVIEEVNKQTSGFKGTKVPVEIEVNPKTKNYTIEIFSPPVAEMIKKELGLESGSSEAGKTIVGNIAFERILAIARTKHQSLLAKDTKSSVKLVVGTCTSMGVLIDNKSPKEIELEVAEGKYDKIIKDEITEVSDEKKKSLEAYFAQVKASQERAKKASEEAKAAAEATKAAGTPTVAPATEASKGVEVAKAPAAAPAGKTAAKPEAAKGKVKKK